MRVSFSHFSLLFFPLLLLIIEYLKFPLLPHYYSTNPDPTYIYLMNGLNIASGNWELGHYDNPGTPLHVLTGVVLFFSHLFFGQDEIIADVLKRPEYYIAICASVLLFFKAFSLFIIGFKVYKSSGKLYAGLTFQLIPFFILFRFTCPALIHPDILLDSGFLLLLAFSFQFIQKPAETTSSFKQTLKTYWPIAFILGGIVATKFSALCILFFALSLLPTFRMRMYFVMISVFSFYFFTLPVFSRLDEFWNFITGIVSHQGQYGSGKEGFMDASVFWPNLISIFNNEYTLIITFALALIMLLVNLTGKRSKHWRVISLGIILTYAIQSIIVGKHFSYHYTLPLHYLFIPTLFVTIQWSIFKFNLIHPKHLSILGFSAFIILTLIGFYRCLNSTVFRTYDSFRMLSTELFIKENKLTPMLFFPGKNSLVLTSSSVEPALWFGKVYSGYLTRWKRTEKLKGIYPNTFLYNELHGTIEDWNEAIPFWRMAIRHPVIFVYEREKGSYNIQDIINGKQAEWGADSIMKLKSIYENEESKEVIYRLDIDTGWISSTFNVVNDITFDFDRTSEQRFVSKDNLFFANGIEYKSTNNSRETNTILLNKNQRVELINVKVSPKDYIVASIWRISDNNKNFIELRTSDGFYHHTGVVVERNDDWEKVEIGFEIPGSFPDSISVGLRNASRSEVYYDNLNIQVWRKAPI